MSFLLFLSTISMPLIIFYVIGFGLIGKRPVYEDFIEGARNGVRVVADILPTLVGLMVGVGVLRTSGCLDAVAGILEKFVENVIGVNGFPSQILPISLVKLFSSSAATGLLIDIFKQYGPDSFLGLAASIMLSCTETVFYTMSIYYHSIKVKKIRWTLVGALSATVAGIAASIFLSSRLIK